MASDVARHPAMPHVLYTSTQKNGVLMLHFHCNKCGDSTDWRCEGAPGMPVYRLGCYVNDHRHGYPPVRNPHP